MGFLDKKEQSTKKRKRRKRKSSEKSKTLVPVKQFKHMIPVTKQLPPETNEQILVYDLNSQFDVRLAFIVRQHLMHDNTTLGYFRVTHWYSLKEM